MPISALPLAAVTIDSAPRTSHGKPRASLMAATLPTKDMALASAAVARRRLRHVRRHVRQA
eukprot:3956563-Prymnesium_polylepis.1